MVNRVPPVAGLVSPVAAFLAGGGTADLAVADGLYGTLSLACAVYMTSVLVRVAEAESAVRVSSS